MSLNPVFEELNPDTILKHAQELIKNDNPVFPVNVFPEPIQHIISETNKNLMFPVDYISASILYAVSLSIGNTHKMEVIGGWKENAVLYMAIVGKPGTNKSHPLSFAIQPLVDRDKEAYKAYMRAKSEYDAIMAMSVKERKADGVDVPDEPTLSKYLVSDFTLEALAKVHSNNIRGIGVYVDELAGWFKNFNRYNSGSEMEFWLSNWSGKPIISDRKSGAPINISNPFISVAGTIQNGILNELGRDSRKHNGFTDRMLFVIPTGVQKQYLSNRGISSEVTELYNEIISRLLAFETELDTYMNPVSNILEFDHEAKEIFTDWFNRNTDLSNDANNSGNEALAGLYAKLETYAARFSLILQLLSYACGEVDKNLVNAKSVRGAIELTEYFRITATKVHEIILNHNPLDKLPSDKRMLFEALPDEFQRENGLAIAESLGIKRATFDRLLTDKDLFRKVRTGEYEKLI